MGAVDLKVSVEVEQSLDDDFQREVGDIRAHFPNALHFIASEMKANLQEHLQSDWYSAYKPKKYQRRTDNTSLGTPLGDETKNMSDEYPTKDSLEFRYYPTGEHARTLWHQRDGDNLIKWIQTDHNNIPARLFWDNFVDEQKQHGIIDAFVTGMKPFVVIPEGEDIALDGDEKLGSIPDWDYLGENDNLPF